MRTDLDARRAEALRHLAAGMLPSEVAKTLGISDRTLRRYLSNGKLLAALRELRSDVLSAVANATMNHSRGAIAALASIAQDEDAPMMARVVAAGKLLEHALKLHEAVTLDERVAALEQRAEAAGQRAG